MDLKIDYLQFDKKDMEKLTGVQKVRNVFINMYGKQTVFSEDAVMLSTIAENFSKSKIYIQNMIEDVKENLQFVIHNNKNIKVLDR